MANTEVRTHTEVKDEGMAVIRGFMHSVKKPAGWDWTMWSSSAAVYDRRRAVTIKVCATADVYIDKRLPSGDIRSKKLAFPSVLEACEYVQGFIARNYLVN